MTTDSDQTQLAWLRPGRGHWSMELRDGARVGLGSLRYYIALRIPTPATENRTHETSHLVNLATKTVLKILKKYV